MMLLDINTLAQYKIQLSEKHKQKIEEIKDPREKLSKYKKYYSKDSIKYLRSLDKALKKKSDSVFAVMRRLEGKRQDVMGKLNNNKVVQRGGLPGLEEIDNPVNRIETESKNHMNKDLPIPPNEINQKATSALNTPFRGPGGRVADVKNKITPYQEYYNQYKNYLNHPDSMQAMVEKVAKEELEQTAEKMAEKSQGMAGMEQLNQQKAFAEEIRNMPEQYRQKMEQYGDQEFAMEEGRQKVKEKAVEFLAQHQNKLAGIQKKMGKLKKIYSKVENSNDLSTAVKRSSLKGKQFKERLFIGVNFQVINLDPFSLDFSPSLGYMFNKKFIIGIGGAYRHTFGEYEPNQTSIPKNQYALNAFAQHDVIKGFFAFVTYEQSNRELPDLNSDETNSAWIPGFMAGAGKTINVHPKINTRIMLLYNFLHEPGQSPYKSPWIFRAGFQLKNPK